jgi:dGTPase
MCISEWISEILLQLKTFNYEKIYLAPQTKNQTPRITACYSALFEHYLQCLNANGKGLPKSIDLMNDVKTGPTSSYTNEERVRDFIAGMTDDFFVEQATSIDCTAPVKARWPM